MEGFSDHDKRIDQLRSMFMTMDRNALDSETILRQSRAGVASLVRCCKQRKSEERSHHEILHSVVVQYILCFKTS